MATILRELVLASFFLRSISSMSRRKLLCNSVCSFSNSSSVKRPSALSLSSSDRLDSNTSLFFWRRMSEVADLSEGRKRRYGTATNSSATSNRRKEYGRNVVMVSVPVTVQNIVQRFLFLLGQFSIRLSCLALQHHTPDYNQPCKQQESRTKP